MGCKEREIIPDYDLTPDQFLYYFEIIGTDGQNIFLTDGYSFDQVLMYWVNVLPDPLRNDTVFSTDHFYFDDLLLITVPNGFNSFDITIDYQNGDFDSLNFYV